MDAFNSPPGEDWWERRLLQQQQERVLPNAPAELASATHSRFDADLQHVGFTGVSELEARDPEYAAIAASAREFTLGLSARADLPSGYETLVSAAQRAADHLARGHALGTEDATLCGNIVHCRWALDEARSCETSLMRVVSRLGRPEFAGLLDRCRELCRAIDERIDSLRQQVWW